MVPDDLPQKQSNVFLTNGMAYYTVIIFLAPSFTHSSFPPAKSIYSNTIPYCTSEVGGIDSLLEGVNERFLKKIKVQIISKTCNMS